MDATCEFELALDDWEEGDSIVIDVPGEQLDKVGELFRVRAEAERLRKALAAARAELKSALPRDQRKPRRPLQFG